jgi:hypothetical protein
MLNQQTLEKLHALRLDGMAEAFRAQCDPAQRDGIRELSFEERFALLAPANLAAAKGQGYSDALPMSLQPERPWMSIDPIQAIANGFHELEEERAFEATTKALSAKKAEALRAEDSPSGEKEAEPDNASRDAEH